MKKVVAFVSILSLTGCAGTTPLVIPSITVPVPPNVAGTVTQVISFVQQQCGVLPEYESVAELVATLAGQGAIVVSAASIANMICAAVPKITTARFASRYHHAVPHPVRIHGVLVRFK